MTSLSYIPGIRAADFFSVQSPRYFAAAIRRHESRANPGRCYTNHNAPIAEQDGTLYVIQIAPPLVKAIELSAYLKFLDDDHCKWIIWRPSWVDNELISGSKHLDAFTNAWRHQCSQFCFSLCGKRYAKLDLFHLVIYDLSRGRLRPRNLPVPYCTEGVVDMLRAGKIFHPVPPALDKLFPSPWDVEEAARRFDIEPVAYNNSQLLDSILLQ